MRRENIFSDYIFNIDEYTQITEQRYDIPLFFRITPNQCVRHIEDCTIPQFTPVSKLTQILLDVTASVQSISILVEKFLR